LVVWRTKQCWGFREATLLQVHAKHVLSTSNCAWSSAICSGRISIPCMGNGMEYFSCPPLSFFLMKICRDSQN